MVGAGPRQTTLEAGAGLRLKYPLSDIGCGELLDFLWMVNPLKQAFALGAAAPRLPP